MSKLSKPLKKPSSQTTKKSVSKTSSSKSAPSKSVVAKSKTVKASQPVTANKRAATSSGKSVVKGAPQSAKSTKAVKGGARGQFRGFKSDESMSTAMKAMGVIGGAMGRGQRNNAPHDESLSDIREVNLAYLMMARQMIKADRHNALFRLGISPEVAKLIESLTPVQMIRLASSDMVLCRFRFDNPLIYDLLSRQGEQTAINQIHATIIAAGNPVEKLINA